MECAGRALAFWTYQATQEMEVESGTQPLRIWLTISRVYQEFCARGLADKYGNLNIQMDKIINDANSEIENLNQKIASM